MSEAERQEYIAQFQRYYIPVTESGCWLWTHHFYSRGYGQIRINRRHVAAHRWSYTLFKGEIPAGLFVMHSCDVVSCVNPDHLSLGTNRDNIIDSLRKGRMKVKITLDDADEMRRRYRNGERARDLAKEYGISKNYALKVIAGEWRNREALYAVS